MVHQVYSYSAKSLYLYLCIPLSGDGELPHSLRGIIGSALKPRNDPGPGVGVWCKMALGAWGTLVLGAWCTLALGPWCTLALGAWCTLALGAWCTLALGTWCTLALGMNCLGRGPLGGSNLILGDTPSSPLDGGLMAVPGALGTPGRPYLNPGTCAGYVPLPR